MKKASLSFVMMLVLIIFASIVVLFVSIRVFNTLEVETQTKVCEIDIAVSNKLINNDDSFWGSQRLVASRITSPYCKTISNEIDLTNNKVGSDAFNEKFTIELGEMIENCWDTFGEGKYLNTFAQKDGWFDDKTNYYFPCYKFKFKFKDSSKSIDVSDLLEISDEKTGLLWQYNTIGKRIPYDVNTAIERYFQGDKNSESYAVFVFNGNGYIEFMETIEDNLGWSLSPNELSSDEIILRSLKVMIFPPISAYITSQKEDFGFYDKQYPNSGIALDKIFSDEWYEVRYYSPYIANPKDYDDVVFNNIKIVPVGLAGGEEVEGII